MLRKFFVLLSVVALVLPVAARAENKSQDYGSITLGMGSSQVAGLANSSGDNGFTGAAFWSGMNLKSEQGVSLARGFFGAKVQAIKYKGVGGQDVAFNLLSVAVGADVSLGGLDALVNAGQPQWPTALDSLYVGFDIGAPLVASEKVLQQMNSGSGNINWKYMVGYHVTDNIDVAWFNETLGNLWVPGTIALVSDVTQSGVELSINW